MITDIPTSPDIAPTYDGTHRHTDISPRITGALDVGGGKGRKIQTTDMTVIVGIDNGISGGLVAIPASVPSQIIAMLPMPTLRARKGNDIALLAVWEWMRDLDSREKMTVIIEEPGGSKSAQAASSKAGSFHALRAMCALKKLRWHRVTPQAWQKVMLPGCAAGETKARALTLAKALWPTESFLASGRCKVRHDGLIDGALIAEYARRMAL